MNDKNDATEKKGPDYVAVIDAEKCTASGECIKVCEVKAISEGPKRLPKIIMCSCAGDPTLPELLPGKAIVDADICTGCGDCVPVCASHAIEMVHVDQYAEALSPADA